MLSLNTKLRNFFVKQKTDPQIKYEIWLDIHNFSPAKGKHLQPFTFWYCPDNFTDWYRRKKDFQANANHCSLARFIRSLTGEHDITYKNSRGTLTVECSLTEKMVKAKLC